jgi:hypothetical protein
MAFLGSFAISLALVFLFFPFWIVMALMTILNLVIPSRKRGVMAGVRDSSDYDEIWAEAIMRRIKHRKKERK